MIRAFAPAKLNLTLEVLGRRADDFHEIASVTQLLDLGDTLEAELADDIELVAPDEAGPLEKNLVLRAALKLRAAAETTQGARLTLRKAIPVASGLGGGSSDAASALALLSVLWTAAGTSHGRLRGLAAELGSDVPLFLSGATTMLLSGRGERVQPLSRLVPGELARFVLVVPPFDLPEKTRRVYAEVRPEDYRLHGWHPNTRAGSRHRSWGPPQSRRAL
jgi:4-diphosphocytidyl-2-C-methyl-D-erythritol kinase